MYPYGHLNSYDDGSFVVEKSFREESEPVKKKNPQ